MNHVLLIGGAGYIGTEMTKYLLKSNYKVRVLDLLLFNNKKAITPFLKLKNFSFVYGDFRNKTKLEKALRGISDVIILAGLVGDSVTKKYPELSYQINDVGMKKCIRNLNNKKLNKVIFISTCSNYGLRDDKYIADENSKLAPLSLYAKSKVAIEKFILKQKGKVDYNPVILRFATAFGLSSRMRLDLTVSHFTYDLAVKKNLLVYDADTWRPYCHVKDFYRLILKVLKADKKLINFEVFNVGGDINNFTKRDIVRLILKFLPKAKVRFKTKGYDPRNYKVSFKKINNFLKFKPKYTLAYGIKELLQNIKKNKFSNKEFDNNQFGNFVINN